MVCDLCQAHRVQHFFLGDATFARDRDAPLDEIKLGDGMSIGIDAQEATELKSFAMPAPVELETPRIGVDFNSNPVFRTSFEHRFDVDFVTGPAKKLPPGEMTEVCRVRVCDRNDDALCLLITAKPEAAVHTGHDKVKSLEHLGRIVSVPSAGMSDSMPFNTRNRPR